MSSRRSAPTRTAHGAAALGDRDDGSGGWREHADGVGLWTSAVAVGDLVRPGQVVGRLELLGIDHAILASAGASGRVVAIAGRGRVRTPIDHGAVLIELDRSATAGAIEAAALGPVTAAGELTIRAPSSGRFYGRSGPGKPAFVAVGATVRPGQTVGLLEVMKSFHRVTAGDDLPPSARVTAIVVKDDADVDAGAVLVRLEATP